MSIVNRISPALFVVIILSFFLPFIEISCSNTSLGTFSGYDVMVGTASEQVQKDKKDDKSGFNIELMIALLSAVAGIGLCFLKKPLDKILPAVMALTGLICLLIFKSSLDSSVQSASQYMAIVQVHYKIGFWIALLFFIAAMVLNAVLIFIKTNPAAVTSDAGDTPPVNPEQNP